VVTTQAQLLAHPMTPVVQISLDLTDITEALATATMARRAGVDWLEAGTPLILAEGLRGVRALRERFPGVPIVADLKTMDGGYLEAEMMAKAGATHVVVMARAHEETLKCVVKAGRDHGDQSDGRQPRLPRHGGGGEAAGRLWVRFCDPSYRLRRTAGHRGGGPAHAESVGPTAREWSRR
jgi:hypothetical protein